MSDLISRQDAIDAFWSLDAELRPSAIDAILNMLKGLPSAQPEVLTCGEGELIAQPEIIRCKDCKHRRDVIVCPMTDISLNVSYAQDDYYCNFAERREDA